MDKKRKVYAPFSLTSEAGVAQTPVEGYIDVNQTIYPTVNTGTVNENGTWAGVRSDDVEFRGFTKDLQIPDTVEILTPVGPTVEDNRIDMSGFKDLFIAVKPSRGGNYTIKAIMAPSSSEQRFANLTPLNDGGLLKGSKETQSDFNSVLSDGNETCAANVWKIFSIMGALKHQRNMQFSITNQSGGLSDIEFAYMRLV